MRTGVYGEDSFFRLYIERQDRLGQHNSITTYLQSRMLGLSSQDSAGCNLSPYREFPEGYSDHILSSRTLTHLPTLMLLRATPGLASRFLQLGCTWLTGNLNTNTSPLP